MNSVVVAVVALLLLVVPSVGLKTSPLKKGLPSPFARDANGTQKIQHIVVLMLENRPFDHMCGWLGQWGVRSDGLTGKEYNEADGKSYYVSPDCPYVTPFDPLHNVKPTTDEIMNGPQWRNPAPMSGFVATHMKKGKPKPETVMHGYSPDRVPAISTLAKEFAIFDKFFASVPGPTFPNRMFFNSGTSHGTTDDKQFWEYVFGMPQRTLLNVLESHNLTWTQYFEDLPDLVIFRDTRNIFNFKFYSEFKKDAAAGKLPYYSWVSPRFIPTSQYPARDQHPNHDVTKGEEIIAEVYEAVRNSPTWNNTLFIVTYDEHGGFYDHVPPPADNVPNPDGHSTTRGDNPFNFTRLGLRVCTVMASPWIEKGVVVGSPADYPARQFEHSSMYATIKALNGFTEELTNRTRFAAPFDFILSDKLRTDCPTTLPTPKAADSEVEKLLHQEQLLLPPNDLQKHLLETMQWAVGVPPEERGKTFSTQEEIGKEVDRLTKLFMSGKVLKDEE